MKVRSRVQKTIMDINDVVQILTWYQRTSSSSVSPTAPIFKWYGDTQPTKGMVTNDYWYNTTDDSLYVYSGGSWSKDTSAILLWTLTEPSYSSQTTSYLYTVQQSLFGDESCIWGEVVLSSSYEAAKAAYNAVNGANDETQTIYIQAVSGTNTMAGTTTWVTETGESTSGDAPGLTPKWTTKRPTYRSNYPVLFVATQRKSVGGVVTCTTPLKDDTTTVIDGGHITTGTIDASQVNVTNIDADNIASGTIDASVITVENIDADNITSGTIDASQVTVKNIDATKITTNKIKANQLDVNDINASNSLTVGAINTSDSATSSAILNSELASDISDASKIATNYLSFNTQTGLDIGYTDTLAKTRITSGGVETFDSNGESTALFGASTRVGKEGTSHAEFSSYGSIFYDCNKEVVGEIAFGSHTSEAQIIRINSIIEGLSVQSVNLPYLPILPLNIDISPVIYNGDIYGEESLVENPYSYSPETVSITQRNTLYTIYVRGSAPIMPAPEHPYNNQIYTFIIDDNNTITITSSDVPDGSVEPGYWSAVITISYEAYLATPYYRFGRLNPIDAKPVGNIGFETGYMCWAKGNNSFATGSETEAWGNDSSTFGIRTIASNDAQLTCGQYNTVDNSALFIVGNGDGDYEFRNNAFVVKDTGDINVNGDISCTGTINESAIPEDEFLTRTVTQQDNISISANGGSNIGFTAPSSTYTTNNIKYKLVSTTPLNVDVFPATTDGTGTTYVIATQTRPGGCYLRNVGTNTAKVRVDCYYLYKKMRNQS